MAERDGRREGELELRDPASQLGAPLRLRWKRPAAGASSKKMRAGQVAGCAMGHKDAPMCSISTGSRCA